jgi:hypothetical protein
MLLKVRDTVRILDLKDKFNECFPYLKIEFYNRPHKWKEGTDSIYQYNENELIGNIRKKHDATILEIKSWHRTGDVEQAFKDQLDLNVQVFRLYRDQWIQSRDSDSLTLQAQSEMAAASIEKGAMPQYEVADVYL